MTQVQNKPWLIPQPYRVYLTRHRNDPMRRRGSPLWKPLIIPLSGGPLSESRLAGRFGDGVRFDSQLPPLTRLLAGSRLKRKHACESLRINSVCDFDVLNSGHRKFSLGPTLRSDGHEHHAPRLALVFQITMQGHRVESMHSNLKPSVFFVGSSAWVSIRQLSF